MVINFDMPQVPEDYVHRIGRTGRAGATGLAVSLVTDEDTSQLRAVERLIKRKIARAEFNPGELPVAKAVAAEPAQPRQGNQPRQQRHGRQPGSSQQPRSAKQSRPQRSTQPAQKPRIINGNSEEGSHSPRRVDDKARSYGQQPRRSGPRSDSRPPRAHGNSQAQPQRAHTDRRDSTHGNDKAQPQGESMWSSLGRNLRSGKLFSRN